MSLDLAMSLRMGTRHGKHGGGPPPGYTGPLDLTATPAVVAYGQRALSAAMLGQPLYTIRRDSDDTTQSFNSGTLDGTAPVAAISAFIGGGNGFGATWFDQSGNGKDAVNADTQQPPWSPNVQAGRPGFVTTENSEFLLIPSVSVAGQVTAFIVGQLSSIDTASASSNLHFFNTDSFGNEPSIDLLNFNDNHEAGGRFALPPGGNIILECFCEFGNKGMLANGADLALDVDFDFLGAVSAFVCDLRLDFDAGPSSTTLEILLYNSILSSSDRTAIRQNIATYYGITLS